MTGRLAVHARAGAFARRLFESLAPDPTTIVVDVAEAAQQLVTPALAHPVLATADLDGDPHVLLGLREPAWVTASAVERLADEPDLALLRHAAPLLASQLIPGSTRVPIEHADTFIVLASDRDELRVRRRNLDGGLVGPALLLAREDIAALFIDAEPEAPARPPIDPTRHSAFLRRLLHLDDAPDDLSARDLLERAPRWHPHGRAAPHPEPTTEAPGRSHHEAPPTIDEPSSPLPPTVQSLTPRLAHADPASASDPSGPLPAATPPIELASPPATHEILHTPTPAAVTRPDADPELHTTPSHTPQLASQPHTPTRTPPPTTPAPDHRASPHTPAPPPSPAPGPLPPSHADPSPVMTAPVIHATPDVPLHRTPALPTIDRATPALAVPTITDRAPARTPLDGPTFAAPHSFPLPTIIAAATTIPTARDPSAHPLDPPPTRSPQPTPALATPSPPPAIPTAAAHPIAPLTPPATCPTSTAPPAIPRPIAPLLLRQLEHPSHEPTPGRHEAPSQSPPSIAHRLLQRPRRPVPSITAPPPLLAAEDHHIAALAVDLAVTCGPVRVDTSNLAATPLPTTAAPLTPGALLRRVPRAARLGGLL